MRITFINVETTGLEETDRVLHYAATVWEDGTTRGTVARRVIPPVPCHPQAQAVNGYNEQEWLRCGATPFCEADAAALWPLLDGAILGGQFTRFDIGMLQREFAALGIPWPKQQRLEVDTRALAMPLLFAGKVRSISLESLCAYYGIHCNGFHHAVRDVEATINVWEHMLGDYLHL